MQSAASGRPATAGGEDVLQRAAERSSFPPDHALCVFDGPGPRRQHISVASRWFIPISLLGFLIIVGGLWMYLSATEEQTPRAWIRVAPDLLAEAAAAKSEVPRVDAVGQNVAKQSGARYARRAPSSGYGEIADRMDDLAVRIRNDAASNGMIKVTAARLDLAADCPQAALHKFESVLGSSPANSAALVGKADALVELGQFERAADAYRRALENSLRPTDVLYNYGVVLCRLSRFGDAAEQFREVVAMDPRNVRGWYNLAALAQRGGRLAEARDAWDKFTAIDPEAPNGWYQLGVVLMDYEEPLEAARCFAIFSALAPGDPDGHFNLAMALSESETYGYALSEIEAADAINPCNAAIMRGRAELHQLIAKEDLGRAEFHNNAAVCIYAQLGAE